MKALGVFLTLVVLLGCLIIVLLLSYIWLSHSCEICNIDNEVVLIDEFNICRTPMKYTSAGIECITHKGKLYVTPNNVSLDER